MHPDLYLQDYRRQEHELTRRLEHRRVAQERAIASAGAARVPTGVVGTERSHVKGRLTARGRRARGAAASVLEPCCSPA